jgi:putative RecB family exonuclease
MVFSHSRLGSFENCPKQYQFRYVLRVPVDTESIEAFCGKLVHEVIERLHRAVQGGRIPSLDAVIRRYDALWDERYDAERITIARAEADAAFYREAGARCLRNFYRRHYPFEDGETLGIEEPVDFSLDAEGDYRMRGVIDRLVRTRDGAVEIHDYKTGQRIPPQGILDRDRQLALYQLALASRFEAGTPMRLVWHYLLFNQVRNSSRTEAELQALREETITRIDQVRSERTFAPRPSALCGWCEYRPLCPAHVEHRCEPQPEPPLRAPLPAGQLSLF